MDEKDITQTFDALKKLCYHLCAPLPPDLTKTICRKTIVQFTKGQIHDQSPIELDELSVCKKIELHLEYLNKQSDVRKFNHLHMRLRCTEIESPSNKRAEILLFLLRLSELQHKRKEKEPFIHGLMLSNVRFRNQPSSSLNTTCPDGKRTSERQILQTSFSSSSIAHRSTSTVERGFIKKKIESVHVKTTTKDERDKERVTRCFSSDAISQIPRGSQARVTTYDSSNVSEEEIVKELLYCFQGIPGKIIKLDHNDGFTIDPQVKVPYPDLVLKLMELGYLHNYIVSKCKILVNSGAVLRAIEAAVRKFKTEYYGMIASLQSEFIHASKVQSGSLNDIRNIRLPTLCSVTSLVSEAFGNLRTVCDVLNAVEHTKGGAAITALYPMSCHGDKRYASILNDIIIHAERPLMRMICTWMVEGELFDPWDEFFISINTSCHDRDIWRNKFVLRSALIPNIISENQASMILRSGKAINFLNVICEERIPIVGMREKLNKMKDANISDLKNPRSELTDIICAISNETSKLVVDTLINKFKLFEHFQGLRRYMLLGQGDFVNYFMDLVEPQMRKPASKLQNHELMSLLGTAIRGSNAAFEDPDVIKRLIVKILQASGGDWGSDVFCLQYLMHDTLDAALRISDGAYSQVFNFLWRTKRMESILLRLRKERWATKNYINFLAEKYADVNGVIMLADKLNLEFLHFARQFHYYILFEVVECLWEKFLQEYKKARSFDDVIKAHDNFIKLIQSKTFHKEESRVFINQFRLIWGLVYELEALEERLFNRIIIECDYETDRQAKIDKYGTSHTEEAQHCVKKKELKSFLDSVKAQYFIINKNYQEFLKKFLLALSSEKSHELTILSDRIDFNDYYKKGDSTISDSMKYSYCNDLFN